MAALVPHVAGWYGKIPALGDFASRRLPQRFISLWDAWLQRGLAASRACLQDRWLDVYLNGPIWNFALLPGVCDKHAWIGTLMPSVDKVGRHFPLTIALELEAHPEVIGTLFGARAWFDAIGQVALSCLDVNCAPALLEMRLSELPFPDYPSADGLEYTAMRKLDSWWTTPSATALELPLSANESLEEVFHAAALNQFARTGGDKTIWWSETTAGSSTKLLAFHGLPSEHEFSLLLDAPDCLPV